MLLIPGFLAGDETLVLLARWLRRGGYRPFRAGIRSNVGCAKTALDALEARLEAEMPGPRVAVVGHSHGGTLGRSLAIRRPDLVSGIVTLGSPLVDQLALHPIARLHVSFVGRLGSLGTPGLFRRECLTGDCCTEIRDAAERPLPERVGFVSIYSRSDGVVDWHSCLDPRARPVEISSSHVGMAVSAAAYARGGRGAGQLRPPAQARGRPGPPSSSPRVVSSPPAAAMCLAVSV